MDIKEKKRLEFTNMVLKRVFIGTVIDTNEKEILKTKIDELSTIPIDEFMEKVRYTANEYISSNSVKEIFNLYYSGLDTKTGIASSMNLSPGRICAQIRKGHIYIELRMIHDPLHSPMLLSKEEYEEYKRLKEKEIEDFKKKKEEQLEYNLQHPDEFLLKDVPFDIIPENVLKLCFKLGLKTLEDFLKTKDIDFMKIPRVGVATTKDISILRFNLCRKLNYKSSMKTGIILFNFCEDSKIIEESSTVRNLKLYQKVKTINTFICVSTSKDPVEPYNEFLNNIRKEYTEEEIVNFNSPYNRIPEDIFEFLVKEFDTIILVYDARINGDSGKDTMIYTAWYAQLMDTGLTIEKKFY